MSRQTRRLVLFLHGYLRPRAARGRKQQFAHTASRRTVRPPYPRASRWLSNVLPDDNALPTSLPPTALLRVAETATRHNKWLVDGLWLTGAIWLIYAMRRRLAPSSRGVQEALRDPLDRCRLTGACEKTRECFRETKNDWTDVVHRARSKLEQGLAQSRFGAQLMDAA
jgi:hypothetical protein